MYSNSFNKNLTTIEAIGQLPDTDSNPFYDYTIIAKTGEQGIQDLGNRTSINDAGKVVLTGDLDTNVFGSNTIFVGDSLSSLTNITSNAANRLYGTAVQINNNDQVVATWRTTSNNSAINLYDGNDEYESSVIASKGKALGGGTRVELILPIASVNNSGESVFAAFDQNFDAQLVTATEPTTVTESALLY